MSATSVYSLRDRLTAALGRAGLVHGDDDSRRGELVLGWGVSLGEARLKALGVNMYDTRPAAAFRPCEPWQLEALIRHFGG